MTYKPQGHTESGNEILVSHLYFLESLEKIDHVIRQSSDMEQTMQSVLDTIISIFDCNRAWLLFPCSPDADSWSIPMERTSPGWPGAFEKGAVIPLTPEVAELFAMLLNARDPVVFDRQTCRPIPYADQFTIKSQMITPVHPKTGKSWLLGVHQCSHHRVWTNSEQNLFKEIGRRLTDALSSLLFFRALWESEERFRTMVEQSPLSIQILTPDGETIIVNHAWEELWGVTIEDVRDYNILQDRQLEKLGLLPYLHRAYAGEAVFVPAAEYNVRETLGKGTRRWVEAYIYPVRDEKGNIRTVVLMHEDITKRKLAEDALRLSEDKFAKAFRSTPTFMSISTIKEGRFIEVNEAFTRVSGYGREEIIGQSATKLNMWVDPSDRDRMISHLRDHGVVYNQEIRFCTKTGEIITVLWSAEMIDTEDEPCILSVGLDITERKKLENQLMHSQKLESVGTLAGGIAHDFNNILTAITGFASVLNRKMPQDDPLKIYVDQILMAADNAAHLTSSLLAFSRKQKVNLKPANLNDIINTADKYLLRIIGEDIDFRKTIGEDMLHVMVDIHQMEHVLMNLCSNARDAMPRGGSLTLSTDSVEINSDFIKSHGYGEPGAYALVSVSDTGTGMDEMTKAKIFEPFFTTKEVNKGTGLGLSIIYGIIKQHSGFINVDSKPGEGTTFRIYLPLVKRSVSDRGAAQPPVIAPAGGKETILVAEDDAMVRQLISLVLAESGYTVIDAKDGEEALKEFINHQDKIQFIISDIVMPKKNGKDLYAQIRNLRPDIKVIFLSGYSEEFMHQKEIIDKDITFISKPVKPDEILRKTREILDRESHHP